MSTLSSISVWANNSITWGALNNLNKSGLTWGNLSRETLIAFCVAAYPTVNAHSLGTIGAALLTGGIYLASRDISQT